MNRRTATIVLNLLLVASMALAACLGPRGKPTSTPPPTPSPTPPAATSTPAPTPTPLPPDEPVPAGVVSPVVVQHSPSTGEEMPLDGRVELIFDRAMDKASVERAIELSPAVAGRFLWPDSRTVQFVPASLDRDTSYHLYVGQGARDTQGATLSGAYRFRFQTVGYLEVSQVIPAPDSKEVEADSTITVMFNRPVVPLVALEQQGDLPDPLVLDPPVEGRGEWLNTSIYVWRPNRPLPGGTRFTGRIAAGLSDVTGGLLADDYVWSFTTQPPKVVWTTPQTEGDRPVRPDTEIRVTFDQPIDLESATQAFSLRREGLLGSQVRGQIEVYTDTLVFTPRERLDFDRTYTARMEAGVTSASGGTGMREAYEWSFKTAPLPRIVRTEPRNGERSASPYTAFQIVFNTVIDPDTVMPNLEMTPPLSPTQVYTYFNEWNYTFVLGFGAQPSTDYQVRIGPDIADPYGNTTGQRMTVRFRTAPLDPEVDLHVPGNVSTLNANDPARIFVSHVNVDQLDIALFKLTTQELLALERNWYDFEPSQALRRWQEKVESPLNERRYTPIDLVEGGGRLEPGAYLVELDSPDVDLSRPELHLLVVSTINLTLKASETELLAWATDLDTGRPVQGLQLQALDWRDGSALDRGTTDADGLARFQVDLPSHYDTILLGDAPFAMGANQWSQGISPWEFGFSGGEGSQDYRVHVYTDRPIYRAGQTVFLRGIVRREQDVAYDLPGLSDVHVTVYDAGGGLAYDRRLSLDAFGAFNGQLDLDPGAPLGSYWLNVEAGNTSWSDTFQVAAYRPPEFEVTVTPDKPEVVLGEGNRATVAVRYFFGGPVQDVPVEWNVLGETYTFAPPQFGRYSFSDTDDPWVCR
jgi:hypothetical protein